MKKHYLSFLIVVFATFIFFGCKTTKTDAKQEFSPKSKSVEELLKKGDQDLTARKYTEALEDFNKAAALDPYSPDIFNYRGMTKYYMNDYPGALIDFNKAIELQPDYAEAYNLRGIVKGELNDDKGACADWEKSYELGFKYAFVLLKKFCQEENNKENNKEMINKKQE